MRVKKLNNLTHPRKECWHWNSLLKQKLMENASYTREWTSLSATGKVYQVIAILTSERETGEMGLFPTCKSGNGSDSGILLA